MVLFRNRAWLLPAVIAVMLIFYLQARNNTADAEILSGSVHQQFMLDETGIIIDNKTGMPIVSAIVSIPSEGLQTLSDETGRFKLNIPDKAPLIMSVNAQGYKPFTATLDKSFNMLNARESMKILIEKLSANHFVIDTGLHHLGDNKFSSRSANAGDFSSDAKGYAFFKEFQLNKPNYGGKATLKIGSIIGIDTIIAQNLRQSRVSGSSSTPVKVFLNSYEIGEISYNGDNKVFHVPEGLLRLSSGNFVEIETGININPTSEKDYDDIEFMNIVLEF